MAGAPGSRRSATALCILIAYWDFTAQKQHERSLRASERLNRTIPSPLHEMLVVVAIEARVVVA